MVRPSLALIASASLVVVACSDRASLPSESKNDRIYIPEEVAQACLSVLPQPLRLGGDTFAELYRDVFSPRGVAKCQTSGCHGDNHGPGSNGMAMYPAVVPEKPTALDKDSHEIAKGGESGKVDDRGLYCGLTTHMVAQGPSTKVAATCPDGGVDCPCFHGPACVCGRGPNKDQNCCNPATDTDKSCVGAPTECDHFCRKLVVSPGPDALQDSELLRLLSTSPDGEAAFMPNSKPCNSNRKLLPEELERIKRWLARGAPYDGDVVQLPYECPPPAPVAD